MVAGVSVDMKVTCKPEFSAYAKQSCAAKFIVSLKAPPTDGSKRVPVSVSVVLDRSGSMAGSKLELVKKTTNFLMSQLNDQDRVSVISYDDNVEVPVELQNATHGNKEAARARVNAIQPGSCTNLSGGLFKGMQQQISASKELEDWQVVERAPVNAVLLFTDGLANVGLTNSDGIVSAMSKLMAGGSNGSVMPSLQNSFKKLFSFKDKADKSTPLMVHTFGFGSDHDEAMLQSIATAGNGTYYFIEKNENIPTAFADALGGLMSVYAQNIELEIKPAMPGVTIRKVHTGFKQSQVGAAHKVQMNDIYCEEQKDLILELDLPAAALDGNQTIAIASLTYMDVMAGAMRTANINLDVERVTEVPTDLNPDEEVTAHWTRIQAARVMEEAMQWAERGHYEKAVDVTRQGHAMVACNIDRCAAAPLGDMLKGIANDLAECQAGFASKDSYRSKGSKIARAQYTSHMSQRSHGRWGSSTSAPGSAGLPPATNMYANAMQVQMSRAAEAVVLEEEEEETQAQLASANAQVHQHIGPLLAHTAAAPPPQAPARP